MIFFNEILFFLHVLVMLLGLFVASSMGEITLSAFLGLLIILANLFVLKQIVLFGFTVTCADVFIVGISLGLGLMQKFFGNNAAKQAINGNLFLSIFYLVCTVFQLGYTPALVDHTQGHYEALLNVMPRLIFASLGVSWTTEQFNRLLLKRFFLIFSPGRASLLASLLAQLWDTVTFSFFGLYGLVDSIVDVMIVSFLIKSLVLFFATPFISLIYHYAPASAIRHESV